MENETNKPLSDIKPINAVGKHAMVRQSVTSTDPLMLMHEIRKLEHWQRLLGEEATRALEVLHNEVASYVWGVKKQLKA